MIREFVGWGILVFMVIGIFWSFYCMWNEANEVHGRLEDFENKAKLAKTKKELTDIATALCIYVNKSCWHRHYGTHAKKVLAYIQGKRECCLN